MAKKKWSFEELLKNDPLDLIGEVKAAPTAARTEQERLVVSFEEVNAFFAKHQREPKEGSVSESSLYFRLKGIREQADKIKILKPYDRYDLLPSQTVAEDYRIIELPSTVAEPPPPEKIIEKKPPVPEIKSIDDILNNDILGILESDGEDIFKLKHVPVPTSEKEVPDYIASREPCEDFEKFASLFTTCQKDLSDKKRQIIDFANEQQIGKGNFFILRGVLCYVAKVGKRERVKKKVNARLRLIFENGTESDMLLRSLAAELYKDGRRVTEHHDKLLDNFSNITDKDTLTGYVYVLQSKSADPQIASIKNLYKIGFSSGPVEKRIQNAAKEPTYLMADVHLVSKYSAYNFDPAKLENMLHRFFGSACLNIDLYDAAGQLFRPREWFIAPFGIIEQAIYAMLEGEIVYYRYDVEREEMVRRE